MGNTNNRQNAAIIAVDARTLLQNDLPKFICQDRLGNGKFMKSYLMKIDGTAVVVKVYLRSGEEDLLNVSIKLTSTWKSISPSKHPNLLPYQMWIKSSTKIGKTTSSPAYLIRQYFGANLYDRLSTRPFLTELEKLWIIYQLMRAVESSHEEGVVHGDIKPENVMVTSWNFVALTDFATMKPVCIPDDDPKDFLYYFDSMGRRRCYVAPERFYKSSVMGSQVVGGAESSNPSLDYESSRLGGELGGSEKIHTPAMDVFSLGCTIAEVLLDGEPLIDFPGMLKYISCCNDQSKIGKMTNLLDEDSPSFGIMNKLVDARMRQIICDMTQYDPANRKSVFFYREKLEEARVFPPFFKSTIFPLFMKLHWEGVTPDDRVGVICLNYEDLMERVSNCTDRETGSFFSQTMSKVLFSTAQSPFNHSSQSSESGVKQTSSNDDFDVFDNPQAAARSSSLSGGGKDEYSSHKNHNHETDVNSARKRSAGYQKLLSKKVSLSQEYNTAKPSDTISDSKISSDVNSNQNFVNAEGLVDLVKQFEKLISDAKNLQNSSVNVNDFINEASGRQDGRKNENTERNEQNTELSSSTVSYDDRLPSKQFDLFAGNEFGAGNRNYSPSSAIDALLTQNKHNRMNRKEMENSNGLLLLIQVICSNIRHLRFAQSKIVSLMLLVRLGLLCSQEIILRRIVPFVVVAIEDHVAVVRACAIKSLRMLMHSIIVISPGETNVFETFLFPVLNVVAKDSEVLVRIAFAESISVLAECAKRFLDIEHYMNQAKIINSDSIPSASNVDAASASGVSSNQVVIESIYDKKLRLLHEQVSRWINDLVLDVGIVSSAEHRKNGSSYASQHCGLIKRALLQDIVRLCIFFGAQESAMGILLAQLLTYLNDQDWELRCAFCLQIPAVCVFLGGTITSECILPCIENVLIDVQEIVVAAATRCLWLLIDMRLLSKSIVVDNVRNVSPLLLHPSSSIRKYAIKLVAAASKFLGAIDSYVFILPIIRPILKFELIGYEISENTLEHCLLSPISRKKYQQGLRSRRNDSNRSTSIGEMLVRNRSESKPKEVLQDMVAKAAPLQKIDESQISSMEHDVTTNLMETLEHEESSRNMSQGKAASKNGVLSVSDIEAEITDEDSQKSRFMYSYLNASSKEMNAKIIQWRSGMRGVGGASSALASPSRVMSLRGNSSAVGLDSLFEVMSPQMALLTEQMLHTILVPHQKFSYSKLSNESIKKLIADCRIDSNITASLLRRAFGIAISEAEVTRTMNAGNVGDPQIDFATSASTGGQSVGSYRARPSAKFPSQVANNENIPSSNVEAPTTLMESSNAIDPKALFKKVMALRIPHISPNFGTLHQPYDGRRYSSFAESIDLTQSVDAQSNQAWKPKENIVICTMYEHSAAVNRLAVSPDQSYFVSASSDHSAKVWQTKGAERNAFPKSVFTYLNHKGPIIDAAPIENSHSIATCSGDGSVHVWRVDVGALKTAKTLSNESSPVKTSSMSASNTPGMPVIKTLDCSEGPVVGVQHFSGDVASVVSFITQGGKIHGWDLRSRQEAFEYTVRPELGYPMSITTSPDRNWLCVGTSEGYISLWDIRYNVMCKLWRHSSKSPVHRLATVKSIPNARNSSNRDAIMPYTEGAYLFVAAGRNEAAVWGIPEGGECLKCFRSMPVTSTKYSNNLSELHDIPIPSSTMMPFQSQHTQKVSPSVEYDDPTVRAIMGRISQSTTSYVITAGTDRYIRYWDLASPNRCFTVSGLDAAQPKPVYETPSPPNLKGKLFVCYDSDIPSSQATLQSQIPIREHRGPVVPTMRYKDSIMDIKSIDVPIRMMISASRSGEIKLWR